MIIGIDGREVIANKTGKGFYIFNILKNILNQKTIFDFIIYTDQNTRFFDKFANVKVKTINLNGLKWHLEVYKNLKKDQVDLFWAPTSYVIPFLLGKSLPYIVTVHDLAAFLYSDFNDKKAKIIEKFTLKKVLKNAIKIFTVSQNTAQDLEKIFKIDKKKIVITYNAFDPQVFSPRKNSGTKNHYILNIGTLEPRKNQLRLIQAFDLIKDEFEDLDLYIGGGKGWQYENIFAEMQKRNLSSRVKFLGYVQDKQLPDLYRNAELFAYPSLYEGFGIPVVEAMACGCPVLTSNNSSLPEVAGKAGVLVKAEDVNEIADGFKKMLKLAGLLPIMLEKNLREN